MEVEGGGPVGGFIVRGGLLGGGGSVSVGELDGRLREEGGSAGSEGH